MEGEGRRIPLVGERAVEVGVFLGRDFGFGPGPQRRAVGELGGLGLGCVREVDRHRHMARLGADHLLDPGAGGVIPGLVHEVEDDAGAARGGLIERQGRDGVGAKAIRRPDGGVILARAARDDIDLACYHEG